jgi:hypothetical protein
MSTVALLPYPFCQPGVIQPYLYGAPLIGSPTPLYYQVHLKCKCKKVEKCCDKKKKHCSCRRGHLINTINYCDWIASRPI